MALRPSLTTGLPFRSVLRFDQPSFVLPGLTAPGELALARTGSSWWHVHPCHTLVDPRAVPGELSEQPAQAAGQGQGAQFLQVVHVASVSLLIRVTDYVSAYGSVHVYGRRGKRRCKITPKW